jgi:methionyl aminopeptidase
VKITIKTKEEIGLIRISSLLVGETIAEVAKHIRAGITTEELNKIADEFILAHDAKAAFKGYRGFPFALCISVNEAVVHGMPGKHELIDGDIISIDCGVLKNGFYGDSAYTFAIGEIDAEKIKLMQVTKECLYLGVNKAIAGNRVGDISFAVQYHAEKNGYGVVRELVGHGVGRKLHEKPEVPNFGRQGSGALLKPGIVIAIEPMINMGTKNVKQLNDGWTVITADNKPSAHFEHTVAVDNLHPEILSSFHAIEEAEIKNQNLFKVSETIHV